MSLRPAQRLARSRLALACAGLGAALGASPDALVAAGDTIPGVGPAPVVGGEAALEAIRISGDVAAQRAHAWQVFERIAADVTSDGRVLRGWRDQSELFDTRKAGGGAGDVAGSSHQSVGAPLILLTHYNAAAARHIALHRLNERPTLDRLRVAGTPDAKLPSLRTVPEFPTESIVVKTCWWPIAAHGATPMPYWDPRREPARRGGNPYTSWKSIVAVIAPDAVASATLRPRGVESSGAAAVVAPADGSDVVFAGRHHPDARHISLDAFHHVRVDARLAQRLMADDEARRAAVVALGRPLAAGDYLALVATHIATRELPEWVWITLWWDPSVQTNAATRAASWRHYALDAAFDATLPRAGDGGPRVVFNPWLEARMPDGGAGDGTRSNCLACHQRASYPGTRFLPVTRGAPDPARDTAFEPGKLRTGFLWSIATRSR